MCNTDGATGGFAGGEQGLKQFVEKGMCEHHQWRVQVLDGHHRNVMYIRGTHISAVHDTQPWFRRLALG